MVGFGIVTGLLFLLMAAVLELNKNTLPGFGLLLAATVVFWVVFSKWLQGGKWYGRADPVSHLAAHPRRARLRGEDAGVHGDGAP